MTKKQIEILLASSAFIFAVYGPRLFNTSIFYTNNTLSAPQGIYMAIPGEPEIGNYVVAELPIDIPEISGKKGTLLIKKVQGVTGSEYWIMKDKLVIRNIEYPITHKTYLPQQKTGYKRVTKNHYLLLNNVFNSLDSRYLGEFPKGKIVTKIILVFDYKSVENFFQKIMKWLTSSMKSLQDEII